MCFDMLFSSMNPPPRSGLCFPLSVLLILLLLLLPPYLALALKYKARIPWLGSVFVPVSRSLFLSLSLSLYIYI